MERRSLAYLIALIACVIAGCGGPPPGVSPTRLPVPRATWTPVPLATWIAQAIPADTRIVWAGTLGGPPRPDDVQEIVIDASGGVTCTDWIGDRWVGRIPQDRLRGILRGFAAADFFSLADYGPGCVYRADNPPDLERVPTVLPMPDAGSAEITITINGRSNSVHHYQYCQGEKFPGLQGMILGVGCERFRQAKEATPTP